MFLPMRPDEGSTQHLLDAMQHVSASTLALLLPVVTNAAALPLLRYTWRIRWYAVFGVTLVSAMSSTHYHACLGWPSSACLGADAHTLRTVDYVWAPLLMALLFLSAMRYYVYPWFSLLSTAYIAVILLSALSSPFGLATHIVVVVVAVLLLYVKAVVLDGAASILAVDYPAALGANSERVLALDGRDRFHFFPLLLGVGLIGASFVGFFLDALPTYWLLHALLWHVPVYFAAYFLVLGTTRDVDGWYDFISWKPRDSASLPPPSVVYSAYRYPSGPV